MPDYPTEKCPDCRSVDIFWAGHLSTGKVAAIESQPRISGNVRISEDTTGKPRYRTVTPTERITTAWGQNLYVNHESVCPRRKRIIRGRRIAA